MQATNDTENKIFLIQWSLKAWYIWDVKEKAQTGIK